MDKAEILRRFEEDLWQSSERTTKDRLFYAGKWLDFAKCSPDHWDRSLVIRFLKSLDDEGYAKGTQRKIFQIVKRVFDAAQVLWPMGKRGAPRMQPSDVVKPALELEEVRAMVEAAKAGTLAADEVAFLALSTTLGLRREELIRIGDEDVKYKDGIIYVRTCKGGVERDQLLPAEIVPFLKAHDFSKVYSLYDMQALYLRIEAKSGIQHKDGAGWHSLRRSLDTILVQWNYIYTKIFLRWKLAGDMAIAYVTLDPLKVDKEVFEKAHPFLLYWRE